MAEPAAAWNHPYRKQERCIPLKVGLDEDPPVLYADADEVGPGYGVPRSPAWNPRTTVHSACVDQPGCVRIDLTETLPPAGRASQLYFHKGGQGYDPPTVPYGHMDGRALADPPPDPIFTAQELDAIGAEPRNRQGFGAGRANPTTVETYRVKPRPIGPADAPNAWLYKDAAHYPGKSLSGARFSKYGDAGPTQGARDQHFAYLCWSWLRKDELDGHPRFEVSGGGAVRALLKPGQVVHRCDVESITTPAWDRLGNEVGRVVAVYVRVPVAGGSELCGWIVHSHLTPKEGGGFRRQMHVTRVQDDV